MGIIKLDMDLREIVKVMCEGNPGALSAMSQMLASDKELGVRAILNLDEAGIRGSNIWLAFKDVCGENIFLLMGMAVHRIAGLKDKVQDCR